MAILSRKTGCRNPSALNFMQNENFNKSKICTQFRRIDVTHTVCTLCRVKISTRGKSAFSAENGCCNTWRKDECNIHLVSTACRPSMSTKGKSAYSAEIWIPHPIFLYCLQNQDNQYRNVCIQSRTNECHMVLHFMLKDGCKLQNFAYNAENLYIISRVFGENRWKTWMQRGAVLQSVQDIVYVATIFLHCRQRQ